MARNVIKLRKVIHLSGLSEINFILLTLSIPVNSQKMVGTVRVPTVKAYKPLSYKQHLPLEQGRPEKGNHLWLKEQSFRRNHLFWGTPVS